MFSIDLILQAQNLTSAFADSFFKLMSTIGEELFVLLLISLIYWCFSKRKAFDLSIVYIASVAVTFGVKKIVNAKRPPSELFNPAIKADTSASFPSGHTNSASTTLFGISSGFFRGKKWWKLLAALLVSALFVFFVGFARMYFGLHYFGDVLFGGILGALIGFFGMWIMEKIRIEEKWFAILLIPAFIIMFFFDNEEIFFMGGCFFALNIGYNIEKKYLKVEIPKNRFAKVVRAIIGLGVTFSIYYLFRLIPDCVELTSTQNAVYLFFMYFIIGMWVFLGSVFVFKYTDNYVIKFYDNYIVKFPQFVKGLFSKIKRPVENKTAVVLHCETNGDADETSDEAINIEKTEDFDGTSERLADDSNLNKQKTTKDE